MKRFVTLSVILFFGFFLHAKISFSQSRVMSMLAKHNASALSGDAAACDDYAHDVEVVLTAEGARGTWEVEGGKDELCGYLKQQSAALTVLQASVSSEFSDVSITKSGFPWLNAEVKYKQSTVISAAALGQTTSISEDVIKVSRTLTGLKITSVQSASKGGF